MITKLQKEILVDMANDYPLRVIRPVVGKIAIRCCHRKITWATFSALQDKGLIQAIPNAQYSTTTSYELTASGTDAARSF